MKILAIIPARRGSKGVPQKNLIDLNGKALIDYTLEVLQDALSDNIISDYVISTDDNTIAQHCSERGFSVPNLRPPELATDEAKTIDLVIYLLEHHNDISKYDALLLMQPTTPFRQKADITDAINLLDRYPEEQTVISVYEDNSPGLDYFYSRSLNMAIPLSDDHSTGLIRQDRTSLLVRNGAIYLARIPFVLEQRRLISSRPLFVSMPKYRSINIDTPDDLLVARAISRVVEDLEDL